jgi:DNA helicase HerA-like ATPase
MMPELAAQEKSGPSRNGVKKVLGQVAWDGPQASNERVIMRSPLINRERVLRDQFVHIVDPEGERSGFLGRIVAGPFFSDRVAMREPSHGAKVTGLSGEAVILAEIEIQGELVAGRPFTSKSRPAPGSVVEELSSDKVADLLGLSGDMCLGSISGQNDVRFHLQSKNKGVLPRNLGIFGTVGSGKSNTAQVVIEEAAANGWAVIVLDVESEYTEMDAPSSDERLVG